LSPECVCVPKLTDKLSFRVCVCVRACDKDGRWLLCACKACRKFASSTRNDKKPVEKNEKKEMRRRKGSCSTHRNELQSCSKLFFCFGATALCNRAKGWVGVYPPLSTPTSAIPLWHTHTRCEDNVAIVAIMPHAKRQFGQCLGHKLQHLGYQHLVTLHLAKEP